MVYKHYLLSITCYAIIILIILNSSIAMFDIESGLFIDITEQRTGRCGYRVKIGHKRTGLRLHVKSIGSDRQGNTSEYDNVKREHPADFNGMESCDENTCEQDTVVPYPIPHPPNNPFNNIHAVYFFNAPVHTCSSSLQDFRLKIVYCTENISQGLSSRVNGICRTIDNYTTISITIPANEDDIKYDRFIVPYIMDTLHDRILPLEYVGNPRVYLHYDDVQVRIEEGKFDRVIFESWDPNRTHQIDLCELNFTAGDWSDVCTLSAKLNDESNNTDDWLSLTRQITSTLTMKNAGAEFKVTFPSHSRVHPCITLLNMNISDSNHPCHGRDWNNIDYADKTVDIPSLRTHLSSLTSLTCTDFHYHPSYFCALPESFKYGNDQSRFSCKYYRLKDGQLVDNCPYYIKYTLSYHQPIQCIPILDIFPQGQNLIAAQDLNGNININIPTVVTEFQPNSVYLAMDELNIPHYATYDNSSQICWYIDLMCEYPVDNPSTGEIANCQISRTLENGERETFFKLKLPEVSDYGSEAVNTRINGIVIGLIVNRPALHDYQSAFHTRTIEKSFIPAYLHRTDSLSNVSIFSSYSLNASIPKADEETIPSDLSLSIDNLLQHNIYPQCEYHSTICTTDPSSNPPIISCSNDTPFSPTLWSTQPHEICHCLQDDSELVPSNIIAAVSYYDGKVDDKFECLPVVFEDSRGELGTKFKIKFAVEQQGQNARRTFDYLIEYHQFVANNDVQNDNTIIITPTSPKLFLNNFEYPGNMYEDHYGHRYLKVNRRIDFSKDSNVSDSEDFLEPFEIQPDLEFEQRVIFDPKAVYDTILDHYNIDEFVGTLEFLVEFTIEKKNIDKQPKIIPPKGRIIIQSQKIYLEYKSQPVVNPSTCIDTGDCELVRGGAYCNPTMGQQGTCQCRDASLIFSPRLGCLPSCPCLNQGRCMYPAEIKGTVEDTLSYTCQCPTGYTGPLCQTRNNKVLDNNRDICDVSSFSPSLCVMGTLGCFDTSQPTEPTCQCSTSWINSPKDPLPLEQCSTCKLEEYCDVQGTHKVTYTRERCGTNRCVCAQGYTGTKCQNKAIYGDMTFKPTELSTKAVDIDDYRRVIMEYLHPRLFSDILPKKYTVDQIGQFYRIYNTNIIYDKSSQVDSSNKLPVLSYHITIIFDPTAIADEIKSNIGNYNILQTSYDEVLSSLIGQWDDITQGLAGTDTESILGTPSQDPLYNPSICDLNPPLDPLPTECITKPDFKDPSYNDEYDKSKELNFLDKPHSANRDTTTDVGMVVGIVIGCCILFIILLIVIIWMKKNKKGCFAPLQKKNKKLDHDNSTNNNKNSGANNSNKHGNNSSSEMTAIDRTRTNATTATTTTDTKSNTSSTIPTPVPGNDGEQLPSGWSKVRDPATGKKYYLNDLTLETSWDAPNSDGTKATSGTDLGW